MADTTDTPQFEMVTVTPALAAEWLKHNVNNRRLRKIRVDTYANELREGHWQFTGDTVKFDTNCNLIDGQHRLAACVETGVTVELLVVRGLAPEAFDVLDRNLPRSASDVFAQHDLADHNRIPAAARLVIGHNIGQIHNHYVLTSFTTTSCLLKEVLSNQESYYRAARVAARARAVGFNPSGLIAFMVLAGSKFDSECVSDFVESCISGTGLEEGDARIALINVMRGPRRPKTNADQLASLIRAWNAWRRNQRRYVIKSWVRGAPFPRFDDDYSGLPDSEAF